MTRDMRCAKVVPVTMVLRDQFWMAMIENIHNRCYLQRPRRQATSLRARLRGMPR
jgi:hypothetical protein